MSNCFSFVSHFCVSWEIHGVFISPSAWSLFVSLPRFSCLFLCLTFNDRSRETSCSPPHFSSARAISYRPVPNFMSTMSMFASFINFKENCILLQTETQSSEQHLNLPARSNDFLLGINEGSIPQLLWNLLICINMSITSFMYINFLTLKAFVKSLAFLLRGKQMQSDAEWTRKWKYLR